MSALSPSVIVCAAVQYSDGLIVAGARHFDRIMHGVRERVLVIDGRPTQGFIDQHGTFYTRKQAWPVAEANNQIIRRVGNDGLDGAGLFSENLY